MTFTDTFLRHWPNDDFLSVYPTGYSITNWLVGSAPFPGLVRTVYNSTAWT